MKAIYPIIGGTAALHKWNLKDPQDLDAAFRLVFNGGWTHSSNGALPNGTNGYANTFLNAKTILQQFSHHHSFYHNTDNIGTAGRSMGGAQSTATTNFRTTIEGSGTQLTFRDLGATNNESGLTASTLKGFRASSRTANNNMFIVKADGTSTTPSTAVASNALPLLNCYLAAEASNLAPARYAAMQVAFHSIGDGLTTAEGLDLRNAVQAYQTTLGRSVGPQTVSDPDAQAFVTAANIEDQIQASAVNQLVIDMKAANIWSKMKAIYPFVGGTATSHKWNLKDPQDLDAAFRLVFNGGWTHSATGALPNGTNGYADTFFNALTDMSIINVSLGSYVAGTVTSGRTHIGYIDSTNRQLFINIPSLTQKRGNTASSVNSSYYMSKTGLTETTQRGFWAASNRSATDRAMICSDASFVYSTLAFSVAQASFNLHVASRNSAGTAGNFDTMEHRFDFIGTALNDTELTNLRTAVQTYNTTLSRQV
jgi:hypothetical protein